MEHIWTIACRLSITAAQSNGITLVDVVEEIGMPRPPAPGALIPVLSLSMDVVTLWGRENVDTPEAGHGRISFLSPDGDALFFQEVAVDLQTAPRARSILRLLGLPPLRQGRHYFRTEQTVSPENPWVEVARLPVMVNTPVNVPAE